MSLRRIIGFHRNVQRFRGGLVFKAHRLCVSLNSRRESNKEEEEEGLEFRCRANMAHTRQSSPDYGLGFRGKVLQMSLRRTPPGHKRKLDSNCRLLIVPLFRGSSRFESLILSHYSRFTCECNKEEINDDDNDDLSTRRFS